VISGVVVGYASVSGPIEASGSDSGASALEFRVPDAA